MDNKINLNNQGYNNFSKSRRSFKDISAPQVRHNKSKNAMELDMLYNLNKTTQNGNDFKKLSKKYRQNADIYNMSTSSFSQNIKGTFAGINFKNILSKLISFGQSKPIEIKESAMLNEIKEQPQIIDKLVKKYLPLDQSVQNISLNMTKKEINNISKIYIVASGSSRNVGSIAKYIFESIADIPVEVDYASEFAHRDPSLRKNDFVIAISQSGQTADTFSALEVAANKGAHTLALTNNTESKIHNLAQSKMYVGADKEKSIAATKSFTAQLINLYALAIHLGEQKGTISSDRARELKKELHLVPYKLDKLINNDQFKKVASKIKDTKSLVLLGRGVNFPVAQEGALKIKETSYIDANGYPSGEFLHGHMAVVDENIPVISIILPDKGKMDNYNLAIGNTKEIKDKRNPYLIIIKSERDKELNDIPQFKDADFISIPEISELISPIFTTVSLQLLALRTAEAAGKDVDNPRSLKKAVTNE